MFSQRAWDVLNARIGCRWEALPIIHPSKKPFYLIHVMEVIDCVDHARSEIEYYDDGRVASIERYCLKPELLVGKHIFRTPMASRGYLLVDDVFRQVVESPQAQGPGISCHTESRRTRVRKGLKEPTGAILPL